MRPTGTKRCGEKRKRTSFFSSCCVNILPIGIRKPYPRFFTSSVCSTPTSEKKKKEKKKVESERMWCRCTHAVLELGLLVAQVVHFLHQITSRDEPTRATPWYSEGRRVRLLWPRHKIWKQWRAGKNCRRCDRHRYLIRLRRVVNIRDERTRSEWSERSR